MELKIEEYIETLKRNNAFNRALWNWNIVPTPAAVAALKLLIVPYGIETADMNAFDFGHDAFNRTLWNWNELSGGMAKNTLPFNRTLWNWNFQDLIPG